MKNNKKHMDFPYIGIKHSVRKFLPFMLILFLLASACNKGEESANPFVGDMDNFSYSDRRGNPYSPSATGGQVDLASFEGFFVWVDYAAPWCNYCTPQSQTTKRLEHSFGDKVVFLTVITSAKAGVAKPTATEQTARDWAQRFQLNPERVVASELWFMTVPQHILYSPTGQTLYRKKGLHSETQIRDILSRYIQDWNDWSEHGKIAKWMKFNTKK